jgi:hypothetical protein
MFAVDALRRSVDNDAPPRQIVGHSSIKATKRHLAFIKIAEVHCAPGTK